MVNGFTVVTNTGEHINVPNGQSWRVSGETFTIHNGARDKIFLGVLENVAAVYNDGEADVKKTRVNK